jgi:lipid-A-disaccharide synthase
MRVGIVAGETSGDLLGARLIAALRARLPQLEFVGIAGPKMQALGARSLFPMEKLAVRGYVEVLRHYREIRGIQKQLIREFSERPPRAFIGVDAPDFNFGVEAALRPRSVATIQFVSPQIWAWRGGRIAKIKQAVSHMLTVFPFETALYERAGIPVSFVGHPLADIVPLTVDRAAARARLGIDATAPLIALLPGSRASELHYHAVLFVETARKIVDKVAGARFVVPLADESTQVQFEKARRAVGAGGLSFEVLRGGSQQALAAADVALIASGTATLEAALLKCPMVITYKLSGLSYLLMRRKAYLPYVGLPNILAQEFIVPEILQDDATPENLAQAVVNLLRDRKVRERLQEKFLRIHDSLKQNSAERIADAVLPYLMRDEG